VISYSNKALAKSLLQFLEAQENAVSQYKAQDRCSSRGPRIIAREASMGFQAYSDGWSHSGHPRNSMRIQLGDILEIPWRIILRPMFFS